MNKVGNVFVLSAPSGTGKSTIAKRLIKRVSNISFSISFTTRKIRPNEINGKDYFFSKQYITNTSVSCVQL